MGTPAVHQGGGGAGETGRGAQRHIDRMGTQHDGVLQGGEDVVKECTAGGTKDLHDQQPGIGGHADHGGGIQAVGGSDARNMGAMVALIVIVVGDIQVPIHIVEGKGNLFAAVEPFGGGTGIHIRCIEGACKVLHILQRQRRLLGSCGEGGGAMSRPVSMTAIIMPLPSYPASQVSTAPTSKELAYCGASFVYRGGFS